MVIGLGTGAIVNSCVLRGGLGGVLHDAVDKFLSFQKMNDLLVTIESPPPLFGMRPKLEHHGQAGASGAASFRPSVAKPDGGER